MGSPDPVEMPRICLWGRAGPVPGRRYPTGTFGPGSLDFKPSPTARCRPPGRQHNRFANEIDRGTDDFNQTHWLLSVLR
jgi:hypothetical protein